MEVENTPNDDEFQSLWNNGQYPSDKHTLDLCEFLMKDYFITEQLYIYLLEYNKQHNNECNYKYYEQRLSEYIEQIDNRNQINTLFDCNLWSINLIISMSNLDRLHIGSIVLRIRIFCNLFVPFSIICLHLSLRCSSLIKYFNFIKLLSIPILFIINFVRVQLTNRAFTKASAPSGLM